MSGEADTSLFHDRALVDQARHGDRSAFDELYHRLGPITWRYALAVSRDPRHRGGRGGGGLRERARRRARHGRRTSLCGPSCSPPRAKQPSIPACSSWPWASIGAPAPSPTRGCLRRPARALAQRTLAGGRRAPSHARSGPGPRRAGGIGDAAHRASPCRAARADRRRVRRDRGSRLPLHCRTPGRLRGRRAEGSRVGSSAKAPRPLRQLPGPARRARRRHLIAAADPSPAHRSGRHRRVAAG